MENRLKERLTGAAILVALVVMLVPEMFHGQRGDIAASAGSSGDGPPVRSYTIDLSNSSSGSAPLQSTPMTAGNAAGEDKPTAAPPPGPAPASETPAITASPDTPASAHAASAPAARPAPAAVPAAPPKAAPAAAANENIARSQPAAPATNTRPVAPAHNASGSGWAVQLGLFAKRDNAERLVHSAQAKGFEVSVSAADARGLYRVYAGGLGDRAAAESYAQRLKDQGLPAAVIAAP
jgi:cell division septation protein DedD